MNAKTDFILAAEVEASVNYQYSYDTGTTTTEADTYKTIASALYDLDPSRGVCMKAKVVLQRGTATAKRGERGELVACSIGIEALSGICRQHLP